MPWATNDGWEYSSWSVIPSETGLAHTGTVVYHQSCNIIVTHLAGFVGLTPQNLISQRKEMYLS
jgi:membrane protein DedA with SNARE-associated domain